MTHITVKNAVERICIEACTIDQWGEQTHDGGKKIAYVTFHSGEKSFTSQAIGETLESLTKKIAAAKNPAKRAPKKRK